MDHVHFDEAALMRDLAQEIAKSTRDLPNDGPDGVQTRMLRTVLPAFHLWFVGEINRETPDSVLESVIASLLTNILASYGSTMSGNPDVVNRIVVARIVVQAMNWLEQDAGSAGSIVGKPMPGGHA